MELNSFIPIAYDPIYRLPLPENHRFPMEKYELLPQQLILEGTCKSSDLFIPITAPLEAVLRIHDKEYVTRLCNINLSKSESRSIGFPLTKELVKREFIIAGGTIMGCEKAFETGIAMNIAGGTHHAFHDRGEAFCLLNDQAIAAQYLLDKKKVTQILILDLDVHQGNGTAAIFESNPNVFTCSVHGSKNYPFRKEKSDLDIALEDGTDDKSYLDKIKVMIPSLLDNIKPDFVFYLCGVDVLSTDKLGRLGLTIEGCKKRDEFVLKQCNARNIPLQCSMGGGYSKDIKVIIEAHANTYRAAKSIYT
ncbi:MAG: acetoin utilization deacetylase AcuC-like enzyme [Flavobacteriaceae bacterium]|jgi:acetoin utilization deacetylase AcuC-like enzyme|tara:strand:+ start:7786 stop:8703 length:918 start_codon:yes stop_codon:yes gene_type:complete